MFPAAANGQPAVAAYVRGGDHGYQLHTLQVLMVTPAGISGNVVFADPGLFATFGLAPRLDPAAGAR